MTQLVDHLGWKADNVEVDDAASGVAFDDIDDAGQERLVAVTGNDHRVDDDARGIIGFVEEGPHEASRVELVLRVGPVTSPDTAANGSPCQLNSARV